MYIVGLRRIGAVVATVGVLVGTACAAPSVVPPPPAPSPTSVVPGPELPPRPREVRLDGLDPCTLLTNAERTQLGLDQEPVSVALPSALYNGGTVALCSIGGYVPRAYSVGILLSVTGGIELYRRDGVPSEIRDITIGGFPGVVAVPPVERFCSVVIDVAPGQVLDVSGSDGGRLPPIPQSELCTDAERVATLALRNLLALR